MLRLPSAFCLAALCLLSVLPAAQAQAQAPTDPSMTVRLETAPKSPTILLGTTLTFKVNVIVSTMYIFCGSPSSVPVKLELKDDGLAGVSGTLPASVDVPLRANVQPPAAQTASGGNQTVSLAVTVAGTAAADHDHKFTVTATTPASLPSGCNAITPNAPKAATATADVALRTGPPGIGPGGTTSASCPATAGATSTAAGCPTTQAAFFVPLQLQLAILLLAGLLGRRR